MSPVVQLFEDVGFGGQKIYRVMVRRGIWMKWVETYKGDLSSIDLIS
jgi:hypothetical protein